MKRILVLGAGRVAGPCIRYLLRQQDMEVTVMDMDVHRARQLVGDSQNGKVLRGNTPGEFEAEIAKSDVVVDLLPSHLHVEIAKLCLKHKKHLVNPSYLSDKLRSMDKEAKDAGIVILSEMGLDPGIDHMLAVSTIDEVHSEGGKVESFYSWCGALPAPDAKLNPFGYKLSWSPEGLLNACVRPAKFLRDGDVVSIPGTLIFESYSLKEFPRVGWMEEYPNGNALPYIEFYRIHEVRNIYRATVRYIGWSETIKKLMELGAFDNTERDMRNMTYKKLVAELVGERNPENTLNSVCKHLGLDRYSAVIKRMQWLGLFEDKNIPIEKGSNKDVLGLLFLRKLRFAEHERDMVIMQHEFLITYPDRKEKIISYLIYYGNVDGETAIAKTTGLPPAIGARLIAYGKVPQKGVIIPVYKEIYKPVLTELEAAGINFVEERHVLG